MEHYAGIDVSLELSSVCIVDTQGKIVKEAKVASDPKDLVTSLRRLGCREANRACDGTTEPFVSGRQLPIAHDFLR